MNHPNQRERRFACIEAEGDMTDFDAVLGAAVDEANEEFLGVFVEDVKLSTVQVAGGQVRYSGILLLTVDATQTPRIGG